MTDSTSTSPALTRVSVSGLDISFGKLTLFFVKAGLAAIPALLIIMLTIGVTGALLRWLFRAGSWGMHHGWY